MPLHSCSLCQQGKICSEKDAPGESTGREGETGAQEDDGNGESNQGDGQRTAQCCSVIPTAVLLNLVPVLKVPILKLVGRVLNLVPVLEVPILKLVDQVLDLVRVLEVRVRNLDLVRMTRIMIRPPRRTY